jgi:glycosyltransferase involved in cell wall biosynthesis
VAELISVGLPTYDGARFIRASIESLLAQDYPDLEIIVSDNASTDETESIVRSYPVKYIKQPDHINVAENFRKVFAATTGAYFMWAGDHDLWSPNLISTAAEALDRRASVVLAYCPTIQIDADGNEVGPMPSTPADVAARTAFARYRRLIWEMDNGNMIYGLIRRAALERTTIGRPLIGADHLVLAELALQGPFQFAPGAQFYRREWRNETDEQASVRRSTEMMLERPDYHALRNGHLQAVRRTQSLSIIEKVAAYLDTIRCFRVRFGV